ncbi:MAG: thioredoxin [Pseudomonadota bacterium]|nr:thioredoxin [Pseudomonadota bacterium]
MSTAIDVTRENFKDVVLDSSLPVLVDFWAPWCGPCKAIAPIVEQLAKDLDGKIVLAKLNVDNDSSITTEYGVRGIPTLILFSNGEVLGSMVGAVTQDKIEKFIEQHID